MRIEGLGIRVFRHSSMSELGGKVLSFLFPAFSSCRNGGQTSWTKTLLGGSGELSKSAYNP